MSDQQVIRIMCPNLGCQRILAVPVDARGKLVRCRSCGMKVRVPSRETAPNSGGGGSKESAA